MSGMKTEGEELKKLLKLGRKRPLPFGFCIGPGDEDHVLIIHRKRKPETLGKAARTEGLGTKIAFGTLTVSGRLITLTCKREAPALAKKMKRFMIRQKLKMNVLVLDAAGRELESDIEELEEDPDWDRDDRASGDTAQEAGSDTPSGPETDDGPRTALVSRLKAVRPGVMARQGGQGEKLKQVLALAAAQLKAGDLARAAQTIAALEKALAPAARAKPGTPKPAATTPSQPAPGAAELAPRLDAARRAIAELDGPDAARLNKAVFIVSRLIAAQDYAKADATLKKITQALSSQSPDAAPDTPGQTGPEPVAVSRDAWVRSRQSLAEGLRKIKEAIDAKASDVPALKGISARSVILFDHARTLDERLEKALEKLARTSDGPARDQLRAQALGLVDEYRAELDKPFFKAVDDNGFVRTDLRATALESLKQVRAALA